MRGCFSYARSERRGAHEKRIPGMPEGLQMRLGGMLRRHMLLYALCVPLYGDFGQREEFHLLRVKTQQRAA